MPHAPRVSAAARPVRIDEQLARRLVDTQFPQWARPADRAGRARRLGQPHLPARRRPDRAAAERRLVRAPGREGAALAAGAGSAAPAADPGAGRQGRARRGLSVRRGRSTAGSTARPRREPRSPTSTAFADRPGRLPRRAAAASTPTAGPAPGRHNFFRGGPLAIYEDETVAADRRRSAARSTATPPCGSGRTRWRRRWEGDPVWFHGDIATGNLLVRDGRLAAVIDFGTSGVGDPACDVVIAWTLLQGESRDAFRRRSAPIAATWARGRGWALWKALISLVGNREEDDAAAAALQPRARSTACSPITAPTGGLERGRERPGAQERGEPPRRLPRREVARDRMPEAPSMPSGTSRKSTNGMETIRSSTHDDEVLGGLERRPRGLRSRRRAARPRRVSSANACCPAGVRSIATIGSPVLDVDVGAPARGPRW